MTIQNPELPSIQKTLELRPVRQEAVLAEHGRDLLTLDLQPTQDLAEIESIRASKLDRSLADLLREHESLQIEHYRLALESEYAKFSRLGHFPAYLNRLANLAAMADEPKRELEYLRQAGAQSQDPHFARRIAANLAGAGQLAEAEHLLRTLDLSSDIEATLRVAAFAVRRGDVAGAAQLVKSAVNIDPSNYEARLFEGGIFLYEKNFRSAIQVLKIAIEAKPSSSVAHMNMGLGYINLRQFDKAMVHLRRSVALSPVNIRAVMLLSDLAFNLARDDEAIPSLRYLTTVDKSEPQLWAHLARACLQIGDAAEAATALKYQASLKEDAGVWNNLGVAHMLRDDKERGIRAFSRAMSLGQGVGGRDYFLAGRNACQWFAANGTPSKLLPLAKSLIAEDRNLKALKDPELSDIYAFFLHALRLLERYDEFEHGATTVLHGERVAPRLRLWIFTALITHLSVRVSKLPEAIRLIDEGSDWLKDVHADSEEGRGAALLNTVAFALIEAGRVDDALPFMEKVASRVHYDSFVTATFGLLDLKRGQLDRGRARYGEAVRLATERDAKTAIRQKLFLELGRYWVGKDDGRAMRNLTRAMELSEGLPVLRDQAGVELSAIRANSSKR